MRRTLLLVAALPLAAACGTRARETARIPPSWQFSNVAPPVVGETAMVASEHPLASQIGAEIMRRGGNAIDAAVAVGFAQVVVNPRAGNIGGGGFLVYRTARGEVYALDYRETAPAAASRTMYLDSAGNVTEASMVGALAAGVPGSVAGMFEMHRRFGRLPWRDLVLPAIALARDGHVVDSARAHVIDSNAARLRRFPSTAAILFPGGRPLQSGTLWRQSELARTLELIADSGPAGFYRGRTAELIVAEMRRTGGIITSADLAGYRAVWRDPIVLRYRGWTIYSIPPASSGGITMGQILNILEGYRRLPAFGSPELLHLEVEAMRRAFTDRNRYLGDPDFVRMPLDRLLSKGYAAELRRQIHRDRATPSAEMPPTVEGSETTHYSIVDTEGNAASVTTTLNDNFGNSIVVTGGGFFLNDEMDDFTSKPGAPNDYGLVQGEANAIAPGKRMLSAMTPSIVLDPYGRLALVLGSPGGPRIISAVAQVISNVIDHGMTLSRAVYAPRIHHQSLPDSIRWEPNGVTPEARRALEAMGHHFFSSPKSNGVVNAVAVTRRGLEGVTDPRIPGGAVGW
ncbi:MAG: gamma-glutamyltransferase [Gemmatimonadetes bacterium GWC2_71_9]|nr:MAG: gamma-glutamyltransferase [Gemmatimonadetes bacterium GWC2_71_9]OGT96102.1 MAG: gamma-glutamyltransferase [Gemmatimonadetes bacterium RIFCSPLOWO2_02_FULL_71_11]